MTPRLGLRRFTMREAAAIRRSAKGGVSRKDIAARYGVDPETIGRIVRGTTYRIPYRMAKRGAAHPDCPCPSCVRSFQEILADADAPSSVSLSGPYRARQLRLLAREFDAQSIRCPWHDAILLVGQRCPRCDYVRLPYTAEDFVDYIQGDLEQSA